MKILIYTVYGDVHARAVEFAMKKRGHEVRTILGEHFPTETKSSMYIGKKGLSKINWGTYDDIGTWEPDVVWNRRFGMPIQDAQLHPADQSFAMLESKFYLRGVAALLCKRAFEINPSSSRKRAQLKPIQLMEADRVGMRIPETLISNNSADIRHFSQMHANKIIVKSAVPHTWLSAGRSATNLTALVTDKDLAELDENASVPSIFQQKLEKHREFRVTIMGRRAFVARMIPADANAVDTRSLMTQYADGTDEFPTSTLDSCFQLMDNLGIVFGCFDFVQTHPGTEPIFLEVNEMGQWLFVEKSFINFHMLDTFCDFCESMDITFPGFGKNQRISFGDFIASPEYKLVQQELHTHVPNQSIRSQMITHE